MPADVDLDFFLSINTHNCRSGFLCCFHHEVILHLSSFRDIILDSPYNFISFAALGEFIVTLLILPGDSFS